MNIDMGNSKAMGGASRYLAHRYGCTVHGVDLNESRVAGARKLTELTGLDDRVTFSLADAANLDLEPERFDAAISQEAFLHIPDKEGVLSGCRPGPPAGGKARFHGLDRIPIPHSRPPTVFRRDLRRGAHQGHRGVSRRSRRGRISGHPGRGPLEFMARHPPRSIGDVPVHGGRDGAPVLPGPS
ncbi:MAG: methyltransferase domain-containing protein [Desulfobacterales bacterium]|nr:methyltransferase domain-containing protein [Desulfobacterales bacterium]